MNGDSKKLSEPGGVPDDLAALAALAREEAADEPDAETQVLLHGLAAGTLTPEEEARLTARVPNATLALYRPLGTGFQARATQRALEGLGDSAVAD